MKPAQLSIGDLVTSDAVGMAYKHVAKKRAKSEKETPEDVFAFHLQAHGLPHFDRGVMFAKQALGRRWLFDFACAQYMVAVEVEGLVVMRVNGELVVKGRHASISGFKEDCIKYASAAQLGWTVLRFEQSQVKSKEAIEYTMRVLHAKGWQP